MGIHKYKDSFGFLSNEWSLEFEGGVVLPLPDYQDSSTWMETYKNIDGFVYPPLQNTYTEDIATGEHCVIPNTEKPASLHRMPASHAIHLDYSGSIESCRTGKSGFIIQLLGYLFGTKLHFHDWWAIGRVPYPGNMVGWFNKETAQEFLTCSLKNWEKLPPHNQKLITNILYMHNHAQIYEWDWERFFIEYTVLDGCWKITESIAKLERVPHSKRIIAMCEIFGIPVVDRANKYNPVDIIETICELRNCLLHETLWEDGQPGSAGRDKSFHATMCLRQIVQRLIPAILGFNASIIRTPWWCMGTCIFNEKQS